VMALAAEHAELPVPEAAGRRITMPGAADRADRADRPG
jgi:hypothetical protein